MDENHGSIEISLRDVEFARRVEAELTPPQAHLWPKTTNPAIAEAVLRALGLRIVDGADDPDTHWVDEIDKRIVLRLNRAGDGWNVSLGN